MSEARTVWHMLEQRRATAASRHRTGVLLAAALLCAMAAAEVLYVRFVAGPDSVDLTTTTLMG
jgi:hypothetical protein